jgi:uncharacterized protein (DUF1697 family)
MARWTALLRAVNLGPSNKIPMAGVREMLAGLGYTEVRTLLASGNAVFEADAEEAEISAAIEAGLRQRFGLATDVLVRSPRQWAALVRANPFPEAASRDPAHLVAMPLKSPPPPEAVQALKAAISGAEQVEVIGRDAYLAYPEVIAGSKLTISLIDRKLGVRGTGRNWNTVLKIAAALAG